MYHALAHRSHTPPPGAPGLLVPFPMRQMGRLKLGESTAEISAQAGGLQADMRDPSSKLHVKGTGAGCEQVHSPS